MHKRIQTHKRFFAKGLVLLALFLCLFSFAATVYAEPEDEEYSEEYVSEEAPEGTSSANDGFGIVEGEPKDAEEKESAPDITETPLPPTGNLTLLEDVVSAVNGNREFLTVYSNDGHYFYIIIDRDNGGNGNVYFLNMVDDSDLFALTEKTSGTSGSSGNIFGGTEKEICTCTEKCTADHINTNCEVCKKDYAKCDCASVTEKEKTEPDQKQDKPVFGQTGKNKFLVYGALAAAVIAVFVFVLIIRKKKAKNGKRPQAVVTNYYEEEEEDENEE